MTATVDDNEPATAQRDENPEGSPYADQLRHVSEDEWIHILSNHHAWLAGDENGERANLQNRDLSLPGVPIRNLRLSDLRRADMRGAKIAGVDLSDADLRDVDLSNATFGGFVTLRGADMRDSILVGADMGESDVNNVRFRGAQLIRTNLKSVHNLLPLQLAGTTLTLSELPLQLKEFNGVEQVNRITTLGRTTFYLLLAASIFALFVVTTTDDVDLIAGSSAERLPLINIDLPIVGFIHVVPIIVLALYLYLTLYLVALFEEISLLPAIFPDGRCLDQHVEPWILTSLVHTYIPNLKNHRPNLSRLREFGAILIGWCIAPLTLGVVWIYYFRAHVLESSFWHALLFVTAVLLGFTTFFIATSKMAGVDSSDTRFAKNGKKLRVVRMALNTMGGLFIALSISYVGVNHPPIGESSPFGVFSQVDEQRFLNVSESIVSLRPAGWQDPLRASLNLVDAKKRADDLVASANDTNQSWRDIYVGIIGDELQSSGIELADLRYKNLQHMQGTRAFMAMANLEYANLDNAILAGADLRAANLNHINARNVILNNAKLQGAQLNFANLQGAQFVGAEMAGVRMIQAELGPGPINAVQGIDTHTNYSQLSKADLTGADLSGAMLQNASLGEAFLKGALLVGATLTNSNLSGAYFNGARLDGANLKGAIFQDTVLAGAVLKATDLSNALNLTQSQLDLACGDDKTILPLGLTIQYCKQ